MRSGQELILATKGYAKDSSLISWWHVLSTLALLVGCLGATLLVEPIWAKLVFSVLAGLFLLRMFVIYHDQQHHAILARSRLAEILMRAFGILSSFTLDLNVCGCVFFVEKVWNHTSWKISGFGF